MKEQSQWQESHYKVLTYRYTVDRVTTTTSPEGGKQNEKQNKSNRVRKKRTTRHHQWIRYSHIPITEGLW
jgi:hypothetical protein